MVVANTTFSGSSTVTRPANTTAYAINDLVANNATAGSVTPLSFTISPSAAVIRRLRVKFSDETVAVPPTIRVWLFDASPTVTNGDNGVFAATLTNSIGYVDVDLANVGSDDIVGWASTDIPVTVGTCYGLLQTLTAFTPINNSSTLTVTIWGLNG